MIADGSDVSSDFKYRIAVESCQLQAALYGVFRIELGSGPSTAIRGDGQGRPSRHVSLSGDYFGLVENCHVVSHYCAFSAYDQAHGDALGFVVMRLVEQIHRAEAGTESESGP